MGGDRVQEGEKVKRGGEEGIKEIRKRVKGREEEGKGERGK